MTYVYWCRSTCFKTVIAARWKKMVEVKRELLALCNVKPGGRQREAVHLPVQGAGGSPSGREDHAVPRYVQHLLYSVADPWHFGTDSCLWLMDPGPDSDPAIFVIDLQDAKKTLIKKKVFLLFTFGRYIYIIFWFFKDKKSNRSHKTVGIKIFLMYYFCLMI